MRRITTFIAVAATAATLGACGPVASEDQFATNNDLIDAIESDIKAPEDESVEGSFADNATNQASVFLEVRCRQCNVEARLDEAVRAVWESEITPLLSFNISVSDLKANETEYLVESLRGEEDRAALTEIYGERPVKSVPDDEE